MKQNRRCSQKATVRPVSVTMIRESFAQEADGDRRMRQDAVGSPPRLNNSREKGLFSLRLSRTVDDRPQSYCLIHHESFYYVLIKAGIQNECPHSHNIFWLWCVFVLITSVSALWLTPPSVCWLASRHLSVFFHPESQLSCLGWFVTCSQTVGVCVCVCVCVRVRVCGCVCVCVCCNEHVFPSAG